MGDLERIGTAAFDQLGDAELPDATLTAEKRALLKQTARDIAEESDEHELMFLAGALEYEVNEMRKGRLS